MANKYWVGGGATANWNATGNTNWSDTDGGANNATVPVAGDDCYFKSSAACTLNVSTTVGSIDCTGYTGTWTHNSSITITLDGAGTNDVLKLVPGMTYAPANNSRLFAFTHTTGSMALTSGGKTIGSLTQNGAGGTIVLQDALTLFPLTGILTLTAGTFNGNSQNVTIGTLTATGSAVREIQIGSGAWLVNGISTTIFDVSGTNMTMAAYTGSITFSTAPTNVRTANLGTSKTFHNIGVVNTGSNSQAMDFTATTGTTITTLAPTAPVVIRFTAAIPYNITNMPLTGTAYNNMIALLAGNGVTPTLALAGAVSADWCAIGGITFSGSTLTATNSIDLEGNSGTVSISGPSGGGGVVGVIGS